MQVERLPLDMASQIQQFYEWLMENKLKATEISLWHGLIHIADKAGYPVWLSVAVTTLEKITGMKKDAIYNARQGLEDSGLIEIRTGKGNQAAQYRLLPFGQAPLEYQDEIEEARQKEVKEEVPVEEPPAEDPPVIEEPPTEERAPLSIFRKMQEIIPFPPSRDVQNIRGFMDEGMEDDLLCEAVDITMQEKKMQDKPPTDKWRYFNGIVRTWYNNGIKTLPQYKKHEKEREERINNGINKQGNRPVQPRAEPQAGMREFRIPGE